MAWGRLTSIGSNMPGAVHDLRDSQLRIGRKAECTVQISGADSRATVVSGVHCQITLDRSTGEVWLEDCSSNGTFLNLKKVGKGNRMRLRTNDKIGLCDAVREDVGSSSAQPAAEAAPSATSAPSVAAAPPPAYAFLFEDLLSDRKPWLHPCRELISTEKTYLDVLDTIVTSFLLPLQQWAAEEAPDAAAAERKGVVTVKELGEIFGNVEVIASRRPDEPDEPLTTRLPC